MTLQIGFAQQIITPSLDRPVYLAGFGRNRRAWAIHDDLYIKALALVQGETRLALVALDLLGLGRMHCLEIERRLQGQVPGTQLLVACTHTHHGPDTIGLWGPDETTSGVDAAYMAELKKKVVATTLAALNQAQPARLRTTSTQVTGVARNARDPHILDEELTCLQFCQPETGSPLVTWLIYPCHPEVLWDTNSDITSDYLDSMRRLVEAETSAPCLAMVGALGGMMTPDVTDHSFGEAETMGQKLAQAALVALIEAPLLPIETLSHHRLEYTIPMTNPLFQLAMQSGLLPNLLNSEGSLTTAADLIKLDRCWFFGVPGELLPKLGLAYKAEMKGAGADLSAIIGLSNDELGYILPKEVFVYPDDPFEPGAHYEETMSLGPAAAPCLSAALQALLNESTV
jgi:hypothetical protein